MGPAGCVGGQVCNADGTGFGACDCGAPMGTDAGATDAGSVDAGLDAGVVDAGPGDAGYCDPTPADGGGTGCATGQRCTWITLDATPTGRTSCLPNGTIAAGGACSPGTPGLTTGFDNCVSGQVCINSICTRTCRVADLTSCGADDSCSAYSGLFANEPNRPQTGACVTGCNPLTQQVSGGASCGTGKGCYVLAGPDSTVAVCANAGTVAHNQPINGTAFANSCVPGAMPRKIFGSSQLECGGLCRPAEVTSTMNPVDEGGVSPDSCQTRWRASAPSNATTGESCRYYWALEQLSGLSRFSNTLGFCFEHASFQYDSNNDQIPDAPWPRCTALTTGDVLPPIVAGSSDALDFWCVQKPVMKLESPSRRMAPASLPRLTGWR